MCICVCECACTSVHVETRKQPQCPSGAAPPSETTLWPGIGGVCWPCWQAGPKDPGSAPSMPGLLMGTITPAFGLSFQCVWRTQVLELAKVCILPAELSPQPTVSALKTANSLVSEEKSTPCSCRGQSLVPSTTRRTHSCL